MSHSRNGLSFPKFILSSSAALSFLLHLREMNDLSKGGWLLVCDGFIYIRQFANDLCQVKWSELLSMVYGSGGLVFLDAKGKSEYFFIGIKARCEVSKLQEVEAVKCQNDHPLVFLWNKKKEVLR